MNENVRDYWRHSHDFNADTRGAERRVNMVFALTTITMVIEIIAGTWFGSMALLADGWHMFTHSAAFAIAMFVYWYARKHQANPAFSFGTGKVTSLGGFASAVALAVVALMMAIESGWRLIEPETIRFNEAIAVAILGLIVNLVSALLLHDGHHHGHSHGHSHTHKTTNDHEHEHEHEHDHSDHHQDHNLKAAYFHVLADTLTSVFAILALIAGKWLGWVWMDALMGIIGAIVIGRWAYGLAVETSRVLLDKNAAPTVAAKIREHVEKQEQDEVLDLHVWPVSPNHVSVILSVATEQSKSPDHYKSALHALGSINHLTVEVNRYITHSSQADMPV